MLSTEIFTLKRHSQLVSIVTLTMFAALYTEVANGHESSFGRDSLELNNLNNQSFLNTTKDLKNLEVNSEVRVSGNKSAYCRSLEEDLERYRQDYQEYYEKLENVEKSLRRLYEKKSQLQQEISDLKQIIRNLEGNVEINMVSPPSPDELLKKGFLLLRRLNIYVMAAESLLFIVGELRNYNTEIGIEAAEYEIVVRQNEQQKIEEEEEKLLSLYDEIYKEWKYHEQRVQNAEESLQDFDSCTDKNASSNTSLIPELSEGIYYAQGTMFNNSRREIVQNENNACIKIVDGPPSPYGGQESILISSLSLKNGKVFMDIEYAGAAYIGVVPGFEILLYPNTHAETAFKLGDEFGPLWEFTNKKTDSRTTPDQNAKMQECLNSQGMYVNRMTGNSIPGIAL